MWLQWITVLRQRVRVMESRKDMIIFRAQSSLCSVLRRKQHGVEQSMVSDGRVGIDIEGQSLVVCRVSFIKTH